MLTVKKKKMTTLSNTGEWRVEVLLCEEGQPKQRFGDFSYFGKLLKLEADMKAEEFLEIGESEHAGKYKLLDIKMSHALKTVTIEVKKI